MVGAAYSVLALGMKRMFAAEKAMSRSPFTEKMLRPAGESLRLKVDQIREEMMEAAMVLSLLLVAPGVLVLVFDVTQLSKLGVCVVVALISYAVAFRYWRRLRKLRKDVRKYRRGFEGQRYVGSELNKLMLRGYRVFHDFVVDWRPGGEESNYNIDHIAVGPEGVFAIETKAIRKPNQGDGRDGHIAEYDGERLHLPGWSGRKPIDQAAGNAATLSKWLTGTSEKPVEVSPILVIPGWFVERKGKGVVQVFSGKELVRSLPSVGSAVGLSAEQIQVIGDRIEAHCRNVDV